MKKTKRLAAAALTLAALLCLAGCRGAEPARPAMTPEVPAVTAPPAPQQTAAPAASPEATATPGVYGGTVLFYNPSGGEFYHLDQNCGRVGAKYLPLMGHFTYDKVNEGPYQNLKPCDACGAPRRP